MAQPLSVSRSRFTFGHALLASLVLMAAGVSTSHAFIRGDADASEQVDVGDAVYLLASLFDPGAPELPCADAGDTNDDGSIDVADAVYLLAALFQPGSAPIPAPWPDAGSDPTPDALPSCGLQGPLTVTTLSNGDESGHDTGAQIVITDAVTWADFWSEHSSEPQPQMDFDTEMVVVVMSVVDSFGITHFIDEIEVVGAEVEIRFTTVYPGVFLPDPSQPHHFVKCERTLATPVFIENVIALP
ncbi:MAG: dockerin type I repeat-containing protein [Planctomycetota bacterium]